MKHANSILFTTSIALPVIGWIVSATTDFGGRSMKELGDQDDYRLAPATYVFWIWWLIYGLWILRTIAVVFDYEGPGFGMHSAWLALLCGALNFTYFPLAAHGYRLVNLILLSVYAVAAHAWLDAYHRDSKTQDEAPPAWMPKWRVVPMVWHFVTRQFLEIHAAWVLLATLLSAVTYATFSNSYTLVPNSTRDTNASGTVAIVLMVLLAVMLVLKYATYGYASTFTWFFIAVLVNNNIDYDDLLNVFIVVSASVVFTLTAVTLLRDTLHDIYHHWKGRRMLASDYPETNPRI